MSTMTTTTPRIATGQPQVAQEVLVGRKDCTSYPDLFQHPALDYEPHDEEYADFTPAQRAEIRATKAQVEQDCKQVCFDCPVLMACAKMFMTENVAGVVGALTLAERRAAIKDHGLQVPDDNAMIEHLISGRGARRQVDPDAVATMTAEGQSAETIAYHFGCNPRTVVRARSRARSNAAAPTPTVDATREVTSADVGLLLAAAQETVNAAARTAPTPAKVKTVTVATTPRVRRTVTAPTRTTVTNRLRAIRLAKTSHAMIAILTVLQDGGWHDQDTLIALGAGHVHSDEALQWWFRANSTPNETGQRVLNPGRELTPITDRVTGGARSKVANMLSASARTRHQTERNTAHQWRFTVVGANAWATANQGATTELVAA